MWVELSFVTKKFSLIISDCLKFYSAFFKLQSIYDSLLNQYPTFFNVRNFQTSPSKDIRIAQAIQQIYTKRTKDQ